MILGNDFRRLWAATGEDVLGAVRAVGESGWYVLGEEVRQFENSLAAQWGPKHAIGVASGLDALELSLRALGCGPGTKVLTTPISAFATVLSITKLGAVPVFVNTDDAGLLDLDAAGRLLEQRPDIRFLVPVHLYGHALDMEHLEALRARFELTIVEDCAQSIGAAFNGKPTGTVGKAAATSFYPTKNLGAMGDGGAVLTNDGVLAAEVRRLRDYGQSAKYVHSALGYNSRLDELQAAILRRAFLPRLEGWTRRRRAIAECYLQGLDHPQIRALEAPAGSESCYHLFPVVVADGRKKALAEHLREGGITTGEHYPTALPDQPAMAGVRFEVDRDYARARAICRDELSLPMHPYLLDSEVQCVIKACNSWS